MKFQNFLLVFASFLLSANIASGQNLEKGKNAYKVIINHEEQYAIWPVIIENHKGWKDTKITGSQAKCQKYIEEVWTDMRPLSVRKMNLPDQTQYAVVINHEEQYSILPVDYDLPLGWKMVGVKGNLQKCSSYIEEVWTDMRPLSLRNRKGLR